MLFIEDAIVQYKIIRILYSQCAQSWAAQETSMKVTEAWPTDKIKVVLYGAIYRKCLLSSTKKSIFYIHDMFSENFIEGILVKKLHHNSSSS